MTKVYESILIYSNKPLKSKFKYKDSFQIIPSQRKTKLFHPIVLQIAFDAPTPYFRFSNKNSDILSRKIIEKLHILSLFSQFFFWGFNKRKIPIKKFSSKYYPDTKTGNIKWYQDKTLDDRNIPEIIFPKDISKWLDIYEKMNSETKKVFRKSLYLYYSGIDLKSSYPSQSFMSLISAIETLINFEEYSPKKCERCNQDEFKVSKRFKDFILKYAYSNKKNESNNKFINDLYSKRSNITHNGNILIADLFWDDKTELVDWKESFLHKDLIGVARVCLINWIIINGQNF